MSIPRDSILRDVPLRQVETLHVPQGGVTVFDLQLIDWHTGLPVVIPDGAEVSARFAAAEQWGGTVALFDVAAEPLDVSAGRFSAALSAADTARAGIWTAVLAVSLDGDLTWTRPYYLEIEPHDLFRSIQPPTLTEIRLHLRDNDPNENYLIDALAFKDSEIAACLRRPVDVFNAMTPFDITFRMSNFAFRGPWIDATIGYLFLIIAEHYRREKLDYATGSSRIDPQGDRGQVYEVLGRQRVEAFMAWAQRAKMAINIDRGFGGVGSEYGSLGRY